MNALILRLHELAAAQPDAEAIICPNYVLSYFDLVERVSHVANELARFGCERLAIFAGNDLDWLLVDLAAASLDIPVVPVPLFFSEQQRAHLLSSSGVDGIYCGAGLLRIKGEALNSELLPGHYRRLPRATAVKHNNFSKVTYTSGSTGTPKGACLSGDTLLTIVSSLAIALKPEGLGRHLCLLPFATLLENVAGIYLPLWMGRSLVIDETERLGLLSNHAFDPQRFCDAVARYGVESVILLPQMLKLIIETGDLSALTSLKFIAVGGGKVAPELLGKAIALDLPVYEGYGLTECGSCVALNTPAAARVGSVGKPLRHANVRISNSGEVMVTGAAMSGYLDQQSGTTEIATGDSGFIDDDGYLYITGRIKNTIISSFGRNISPEWVESAFLAHPAVNQLAVFGEGEPSLSAVIVADEGTSDAQLMLIIKSINQSLPDYAQITRWHRSSEPFTSVAGTLTTNGKLRRAEIAKQFSGALVQGKAVAA